MNLSIWFQIGVIGLLITAEAAAQTVPDTTPPSITCPLILELPAVRTQVGDTLSSVSLAWDPNLEEDLMGYNVYYGEASGVYRSRTTLGTDTTYRIGGLKPGGTYFFAVTAYNQAGAESDYSEEVHYSVPTNTTQTITVTRPTNLAQFLAQGGAVTDDSDTNLTYTCQDGPLLGGICGGMMIRMHTVTDSWNNSAQCMQIITVRDFIPPDIICPAAQILTTDSNQLTRSNVTFVVSASDNADNNPAIMCTPASGTTFPIGTNTVTCVATDACDNTASCYFTVVIAAPEKVGPPLFFLHYAFEELSGTNALDSSGNGLDGFLINGPTRTNGIIGGALHFDGSNNRVVVSNSTSLNVTGALSLGCWVRPATVSGSSQLMIKGKQSSAAYAYALRASDAQIQYRWVSPDGTESKFKTSGNVLSVGQWTHVAVVHTPGSLPVIYINGDAVPASLTAGSASGLIRPSSNPFTVGSSSDGDDAFFGQLDEVVVCARALTAAEIKALMNGSLPEVTLPPGSGGQTTPATLNLSLDANRVVLTWNAIRGQGYQVQFKERVGETDWQDLSGEIVAEDSVGRFEEGLEQAAQRFYRVVMQPK